MGAGLFRGVIRRTVSQGRKGARDWALPMLARGLSLEPEIQKLVRLLLRNVGLHLGAGLLLSHLDSVVQLEHFWLVTGRIQPAESDDTF